MHQTKECNPWYFGMKAHIGVDARTGLVRSVTTTAANVADVIQVETLFHGREKAVFADAGYLVADVKVRYRGLAKNGAQVLMLFALANL